jgi:hypothetical protein
MSLHSDILSLFRNCNFQNHDPISKNNRQHNGQKKIYKRTNNDLQNIHIKPKIE